jgi:hypothetical protein
MYGIYRYIWFWPTLYVTCNTHKHSITQLLCGTHDTQLCSVSSCHSPLSPFHSQTSLQVVLNIMRNHHTHTQTHTHTKRCATTHTHTHAHILTKPRDINDTQLLRNASLALPLSSFLILCLLASRSLCRCCLFNRTPAFFYCLCANLESATELSHPVT